MIGLLILFIAIISYQDPKGRAFSLTLFVGFLDANYGGYCILTNELIGIDNADLGFIFGLLILIQEHKKLNVMQDVIGRSIIFFTLFTFCSFIYSLFHYHISVFEALQNGRIFMMFPIVYFVFQCQSYSVLKKTITYIYRVLAVTSLLYILQVIFSTAIMPYPIDMGIHQFGGLIVPRFYNFPPFIAVICVIIFYFKAGLEKKELLICRIIYICALICTFGRTLMITVFLGFLGVYIFKKRISIKRILFIGLCILVILVNGAFEMVVNNTTFSDLKNTLSGNFLENPYGIEGDATLSFRIAWFYERFYYLLQSSLWEKIFGLGWFSESSAAYMYDFIIGFRTQDKSIVQLYTPDISYGLIMVRLGIGGLLIYFYLIYVIAKKIFIRLHVDILSLLTFIGLVMNIILGFTGLTMAYPFSFSLLFILYFISIKFQCHEFEKA